MKPFISLTFVCLIALQSIFAQNLSGTWVNASQTNMIQLKQVRNGYHGTITGQEGVFAFKMSGTARQLKGTLYSSAGNFSFTGYGQGNQLSFTLNGASDTYYKYAETHALDGVDLTDYMLSTPNVNQQSQSYSNHQQNSTQSGGLRDQIAGCQLVYYREASIFSGTRSSSITYVNFCPNGSFNVNYEGSYSVEGSGGNAHGAGNGQYSGRWDVISQNGGPALRMRYNNGSVEVYPINLQRLRQGRWKVGQTQYAIQRGGARCR
ncbi:MAG: hypothetical protein AAF206_05255 [Bacteroidota bacterium]